MEKKKSMIEFINKISEKNNSIPYADIIRIQNMGQSRTTTISTPLLDWEEARENPYTDMMGDVEELDGTLSSWSEEFVLYANNDWIRQTVGNFLEFCNSKNYPFHNYLPYTIESHLFWAWDWLDTNWDLRPNEVAVNEPVERVYDFSATHIA